MRIWEILRGSRLLMVLCAAMTLAVPLGAQEKTADYVAGAPSDPSQAWALAAGGRLYDNWMEALAQEAPEGNHPLWPASNTEKSGKDTWRCKSCHGWDYLGAKGQNGTGSWKTGIGGVDHVAGRDPKVIAALFMDSRHGFAQRLPRTESTWLAMFLAQGQLVTSKFVDAGGKVKGDATRGKAVFETVCAACHGYDGRTLNWGNSASPAYVGTESNANPWEVLHKIVNGHPGHNMVALRASPIEDAASILVYAQSLPQQ